MKQLIAALAVTGALACGAACAQAPVVNINSDSHPALARAQQSIRVAYKNISEAEKANGNDLGGHTSRAKELLDQADVELRAAADVANQIKKSKRK